MYQALYRKYRPRFFRDVAGQEHITGVLSKEVSEGTFSHAYLFTGSRGIGKTTCAKILAKAVNCPNECGGEPCGACPVCRGIDDGSLLDVTEMDAASNRNIDDIRNLRSEANFTPAVAKYRVYIIDEAHMLTKEAANALLKILEEPPEHVIFILATTEVNRLPNTILSRCMRFDFRRMPPDVIAERVRYVCDCENINIEDDAALLIGKLADGGMRDALSLLDICRSGGEVITAETVSRCAGMAGSGYLYDLCDMIAARDTSSLLSLVDRLYEESADITRICDELIGHYRNLMVASCSRNAGDILKVLPDELERISLQAGKISRAEIFYALSVLEDTAVKMSQSASKRLEFEMALLKLCTPEASVSPEALAARVDALEAEVRRLRNGAVQAQPAPRPVQPVEVQSPARAPAAEPVTAPAAEQPAPERAAAPSVQGDGPFQRWDEVIDRIRQTSPCIYPFVEKTRAYVSGTRILIEADNEMFFEFMRNNAGANETVKSAIEDVCGKRYGIGPYRREKNETDSESPLAKIAANARAMGIDLEITD